MIQWVTSPDNAATASAVDQNGSILVQVHQRDSLRAPPGLGGHDNSDFFVVPLEGIQKSTATTVKYTSTDEEGVTGYRTQASGSFQSTELLDHDKSGEEGVENDARRSLSDISTSSLVVNSQPLSGQQAPLGVEENRDCQR